MGKSGLHPSNNIFPVKGSCCKLAGWGLIEDGTLPEELQEVGVPIVDLITCANSHAKDCTDIKTKRDPTFNCPIISSDTFCAVGKDEKDSCTVSYHCRPIIVPLRYKWLKKNASNMAINQSFCTAQGSI